ncbi:MAG: hypothetical protein WKF55_00050 [Gemmatimonadaceae bacterium]
MTVTPCWPLKSLSNTENDRQPRDREVDRRVAAEPRKLAIAARNGRSVLGPEM